MFNFRDKENPIAFDKGTISFRDLMEFISTNSFVKPIDKKSDL